jgi:glycosyltransferase EpsE
MRFIKLPKISVIMGIYNCENTVGDAIESILGQTYSNFELIMCDDGSEDRTYEIASNYAKHYQNIILLKNDKNEGLAYTLNKCLRSSKGTLIARQDGDDFSAPERFQRQVDYFLKDTHLAIVSTGTTQFDETGFWGGIMLPAFPSKLDFLSNSPFCHGSAMIKKNSLLAVNGYDTTRSSLRSEDYDLWFRMYAAGYSGINLQEALYFVREDRTALKRRQFRYRLIESRTRFKGYKMLKLPLTGYVFVLRPIFVGLVPEVIYAAIRKKKYALVQRGEGQ